jgi:hypothetical protein
LITEVLSWLTAKWSRIWTIVFVANLIVPLCLGLLMTYSGGRVGMFTGIVALWIVGQFVVAWSEKLAVVLISGAIPIFFLQFLLGPHMLLGGAVLDFWMGNSYLQVQLSQLDGFVVTALTGGALIATAIVFGLILVLLSSLIRPNETARSVNS